ncbi:MAG: adenylate/guanylate cyclase domain-containing protein, partial [Armatimonadetes bacterium]|nr:adenylate/guanylate cyclase domain-containing protein [Armatimonadota bacterium]
YFLGLQAKDVVLDEGGEVRMGDLVHIPVTGPQLVSLDFYDEKNKFPHISCADVFDDSKLAASNVSLANRVAIVGWSATGVVDLRPSPLDRTRPGVEHIATLVDNILNGHFMIESPEWVNVLMILLVGTVMAIIIIRLSPARGGTFTASFFVAYVAIAVFFFTTRSIVIEVIPPTLVIFLAYATITAYRLATEEKEKKLIRDTFGSYVSSQVVDELIKSPEKAMLGGTRKEVSVLFADVRGFTSMSEKMAPERVVEYLNALFQPMNDIIFEYEGTIDNIIGDCLMAVFNAPADQPDHAERAVQTGVAMLTEVKRLQQEWQAQGRPLLSMGIGINTGEVVVGNVGSASRKQYTVIGDEVNLAARLESLTRQYKVDIIIGEATYEVVKAQVRARPLGEVIVKGKTQPVTIYEVLAVDGSGVLEPGPVSEGPVKQEYPSAGASVQPGLIESATLASTPTQPPRSS